MSCIAVIQRLITYKRRPSECFLLSKFITCKGLTNGSVKRVKLGLSIGAFTVVHSLTAESKLNPPDKQDDECVSEENPGWVRLKAMYTTNEFGQLSKELTATIHSTFSAGFIGLIYGGVVKSRAAFHDFMQRNQATAFENHIDAKRRLQNHVTIHFGKGALHWGIKLSVFTGGFMLFLTSMAVYRGESSILDYVASGAIVGGLLRLQLGPPAIITGATLGGILGCLSGVMTQGIFYFTGNSLDEVIAFQYELDKNRKDLFKQAEGNALKGLMDPKAVRLLELHDKYHEDSQNTTTDS